MKFWAALMLALSLSSVAVVGSFELESIQPLIDQFNPYKYVYLYDSSHLELAWQRDSGLVGELFQVNGSPRVYLYDLQSILNHDYAIGNMTFRGYYDWNIIYCRMLTADAYDDSSGSRSINFTSLIIFDDISTFLKVNFY